MRLVASGHLHRGKTGTLPGGIETVWAPATSFLGRDRHDGAVRRAGIVEYEFDGDDVRHRMVIPDGMRDFEVGEIMETYGSLRFAPESPWRPDVASIATPAIGPPVVDREGLVAFAQALVRIPSVHDPARGLNEAPVAHLVADAARRLGLVAGRSRRWRRGAPT